VGLPGRPVAESAHSVPATAVGVMIFGVMKMTSSVLSFVSVLFLKSQPMTGRLARNGSRASCRPGSR